MTISASDIITRAELNLPTEFHEDKLTSTVKLRYLNDVQKQAQRSHNFNFMKQEVTRDTTDETQTYSLPTAGDSNWTRAAGPATVLRFKRDISLELINSESYRVPLVKLHKENLEDKKELAKETGKGIPRFYDVDMSLIWLYKIPDHDKNASSAWSMNFEFYGYLADLASDGNNEITNNHPLLLEYGLTARCFAFAREFDSANYWKGEAQTVFAQMVEEDLNLQRGGIEEGLRPVPAQSIGGGNVYKGFMQGTDWYTS